MKTEADVLGVLLLPAIVDDTSVLAYAKAHGLVRDWPRFLARAARCLLLDPFKVRGLRPLSLPLVTEAMTIPGAELMSPVLRPCILGQAAQSNQQVVQSCWPSALPVRTCTCG